MEELKKHFGRFIHKENQFYYGKLERLFEEFIKGKDIKFIYSKSPLDPENAEHYFFLKTGDLVVAKIEGEHNNLDFSVSKIVEKKLNYRGIRQASLIITFENGREIEFDSADCNDEEYEEYYIKSIKEMYKML